MLIRIMVGVISVALSVSLASFSAFGQQGSEDHIIPLSILEQDGRSEQIVKPHSLRVKGVPGQVERVELDSGPRRIILLLDASGSMTRSPEPRWQYAIQIAKEFLSMLQPADRVALHVFAVKHLILSSYTGDFGFVARQLDALPPPDTKESKKSLGAHTKLGEAFADILRGVKKDHRFGDAIILISGAKWSPASEKVQLNMLAPDFAGLGLRVILLRVALPPFSDLVGNLTGFEKTVGDYRRAARWALLNYADVEQFVQTTGGATLDPWDPVVVNPALFNLPSIPPEILHASARDASGFVHNVYRVELELPSPLRKPKKITLELLDDRGNHIKHPILMYPRILLPGGRSPQP